MRHTVKCNVHFILYQNLLIKVIGSNIHTSVYHKRDDFGFTIVKGFPEGLMVDMVSKAK